MEGKTLFDKYVTGELLGAGNFGKVYKARSLADDEIVAIKVIDKDQVRKHGMVQQVKKEIKVMPIVKHPNIVELKEVMATKSNIYLVMEYVGGGELYSKILNEGKLDETLARKYFHQLISAVNFCHSRGVCHRDLKLENILLDTNEERIKLADFGLATLPGEGTNATDGLLYTPCGAYAYMAPEIVRGVRYDGKKADIWSCGVILFALCAGYPPFQDLNRMRMLWKIRTGKYDFPLEFSDELRNLIEKILILNPSERITMEEIIRSPWLQQYEHEHGYKDQLKSTLREGIPCSSPAYPDSFNAFNFISSMSSGLDLSGLFDTRKSNLGTTFITKRTTKEVAAAVERLAQRLKYEVKKEKGSMRMVLTGTKDGGKGRLVVGVAAFEVSQGVNVVEFSRWAGDPLEYEKLMDEEVRPAMKDIALKWQGDWLHGRKNAGSGTSRRMLSCF